MRTRRHSASIKAGVLGQFDHPDFTAAIRLTADAAMAHNKALGMLLPKPADLDHCLALGFRFIASGSDAVLLDNAARGLVRSLRDKLN